MRLRIGVVWAFILAGALAAGPLRADSVAIQNASFETTNPLTGLCGAVPCYNYGPIPDWTLNGTGGSFQPTSTYFTSVPDGNMVAFISSTGGTISQTLGVSLLPDTTYTLSVDVGNRLDGFGSGTGFSISLDAGSTILKTITAAQFDDHARNLPEETLTYTTGSTVLPGTYDYRPGQRGLWQSNFDDVRLTTSSTSSSVPVPEPSGLLLLCMGLFCLALFSAFLAAKANPTGLRRRLRKISGEVGQPSYLASVSPITHLA